jgi:hypothetical protein
VEVISEPLAWTTVATILASMATGRRRGRTSSGRARKGTARPDFLDVDDSRN